MSASGNARDVAVRAAAASRPKTNAPVAVAGDPLVALAERLQARLPRRGLTVATRRVVHRRARRPTPHRRPRLAAATSSAGSSSYADEAKAAQLGVPAAVLAAHGAVSAQVARAMAEGARDRGSARTSASASPGVAGPDGGSDDEAGRPRRTSPSPTRPASTCGASSGPATGARTSRQRGGGARALLPASRRPTASRDARSAGDAGDRARPQSGPASRPPAPPARSGRASGSTSSGRPAPGASAAALLAACGRRGRRRLRPGRPVAVHAAPLEAAGHPVAWEHDPAHVDGRMPPPDRLAVTKALTAIAPGSPGARRRARGRHPGRAVAAGRRRRGARAGR